MKAKRILLMVVMVGWGVLGFGQRPNLNPASTGVNSWSFATKFSTHPMYLYQRQNSDPPFYWGFWIFGDGEYFPSDMRTAPNHWQKYGAYTPVLPPPVGQPLYSPVGTGGQYAQELKTEHFFPAASAATDYEVVNYILRRKTDPPPVGIGIPPPGPEDYPVQLASQPLMVHVPASNGPFNRQTLLPNSNSGSESIYLEHSHGYYAHQDEESVFAISYKPSSTCALSKGKILLFYNAELTRSTNDWQLQPLSLLNSASVFQYTNKAHPPKYYNVTAPAADPFHVPVPETAKIFDSSVIPNTNFKNAYYDVLEFSFDSSYINRVRTTIDQGEFRIFPEFRTMHDPLNTNQVSALVVLTSECPISPYGNTPQRVRLQALLTGMIPPSDITLDPIPLGNSWIVDADSVLLKSGEPIDPNHLVVTNICACGAKKFKVTLELSYCNVSATAAPGAVIQLNRLDQSVFQFCDQPEVFDGDSKAAKIKSWNASSGILEIEPDNAIGQLVTSGKCATVRFSLLFTSTAADPSADLGDRLDSAPVVSGNVQFGGSIDRIWFMNDLVMDSNPVLDGRKISCDCCCFQICLVWWKQALVLLAGAAVLFLGFQVFPKIMTLQIKR